jgi:hypothetical protein
VKVFLSGAAVSLATGLLLGFAMQPQLNIDERHPAGPQMAMHEAGARSDGPIENGAALASYAGVFPDYVLGTNWKKSMTSPAVIAVTEPREVSPAPPAPDEDVVVARAAEESPPQTHSYPSMIGEHPSVIEIAQTPEPNR